MPQMMGRVIQGVPFPQGIFLSNFGTELIYSLVIIVCSLMIYFGTKELYEISSYKGLKYFRQTFLFFAIAYFVRFFIKFALSYFNISRIFEIPNYVLSFAVGRASLFLFMYFSSMAIFYLFYSVIWKKLKSEKLYLFHILAILIALLIALFENVLFYLLINLGLFALILVAIFILNKNPKKKFNMHIIYALLCVFWILNMLEILLPNFLRASNLLIYFSSIVIFLLMVYKVLRKCGGN